MVPAACRGMHGDVGRALDHEGRDSRRVAAGGQEPAGTPSPLIVHGEGSLCTPAPPP